MLEHPNPSPPPAERGDVCVTLAIGRYESMGEDRPPELTERWGQIIQPLDGTTFGGDTWEAVADAALAQFEALGTIDGLVALSYAPVNEPWSTASADYLAEYLTGLADGEDDLPVRAVLRRAATMAFVLGFAAVQESEDSAA